MPGGDEYNEDDAADAGDSVNNKDDGNGGNGTSDSGGGDGPDTDHSYDTSGKNDGMTWSTLSAGRGRHDS